MTVNYAMNPTTFIEGTYGFIRNQLAGGGIETGGILINDSANRLNGLAGLPAALPERRRRRSSATTRTGS